MSYEYNECGCWPIEKFSFRYQYFALIDTADYLADQLFIKHSSGHPKVQPSEREEDPAEGGDDDG